MTMHEAAGPISVSDELRALLRLCAALGEVIPPAPTFPLRKVHAIESELGVVLPDDVLAVLASGSEMLRCATNLAFAEILEIAEDWSDGVPDDHVAIAAVYHEPFAERDEGAHGGPYEVIAIPRASSSSRAIVVVSDGAPGERTTLATFAREKIEGWYRHQEGWLRAVDEASHASATPFAPRIVGAVPSASTAEERWVTHAKLGRGRLLEVHDDKWTVQFASGKKVLKASFFEAEASAAPVEPALPAPPPPPSHPLWESFAEKLRARGVDPMREFYEQADASKGHAAEGHQYRRRDADRRVLVTLRVLEELTNVKLPRSFRFEESESESWLAPKDCFLRAVRS